MSKRTQSESINEDSNKKIKMDNVKEETFINYCTAPALENIVAVSIITEQWKKVDYAQQMGSRLCKSERMEVIEKWKRKISENISHYCLPEALRSKVSNMISPLGFQIFKWLEYIRIHSLSLISLEQFECIRWTNNGTIKMLETFNLMIEKNYAGKKDTDLFEMACRMCCENLIRELWNNIPSFKQKYLCEYSYRSPDVFVVFWIHLINDNMDDLLHAVLRGNYNIIIDSNHTVYRDIFIYSIEEGNLEAVKYFWNKLTKEEINNLETWIRRALKNKELWYYTDDDNGFYHDYDYGDDDDDDDEYDEEYYNEIDDNDDVSDRNTERFDERKQQLTNEFYDVIFYLLSKINKNRRQVEIIWEFKSTILDALFSYWPWQKFLTPTVQLLWDFANDEQEYTDILIPLLSNLRKGEFRKKLFMELFAIIPMNFKNNQLQIFLDDIGEVLSIYPAIFKEALKDNDINTFEALLNDFTDEKKKIIINSKFYKDNIISLIYRDINKITEIDNLLQKIMTHKRDIKQFKISLVDEHDIRITHNWLYMDNRVAMDTFMKWIFTSKKDIKTFKHRHARNIITDYKGNLELQKFINWCFDSEEDVYDFKIYVTRYERLKSIITTIIGTHLNFTFAFEFLNWCLEPEDVKHFKKRLFLSAAGMKLFEAFLYNTPFSSAKRSTKFLSEWYGPMEKDAIARFRDRVKRIKKRIFRQRKYSPFTDNIVRKRKKLFELLVQFVLRMERYDLDEDEIDGSSEGSISSSDVLESDEAE